MNADFKDTDPETYSVIGAAMEVHSVLGHGFLEAVYQDAFAVELASRQIPFEREKILKIQYKGGILPSSYKADFICFDSLLVECKALGALTRIEESQVLNYLRITDLPRAILLNFGTSSLQFKRLVFTKEKICANLR